MRLRSSTYSAHYAVMHANNTPQRGHTSRRSLILQLNAAMRITYGTGQRTAARQVSDLAGTPKERSERNADCALSAALLRSHASEVSRVTFVLRRNAPTEGCCSNAEGSPVTAELLYTPWMFLTRQHVNNVAKMPSQLLLAGVSQGWCVISCRENSLRWTERKARWHETSLK